jgi:hypothetical protein
MKKIVLISALVAFSFNSFAYSPYLVSPDGTYLGTLSDNKYDPDSVSNPYGRYGSKYSADSINNPYGTYGSKYSDKSSNNPYATSAPNIYGR